MKQQRTLLSISLLIVLLGGGSYFYWQQTPSYALIQLVKAVEDKNQPQFHRYVDLDRVVDHLVDDLIGVALQPPGKSRDKKSEANSLSALGQTLLKSMGQGLGEFFKPELKKRVHQEIDKIFSESSKPTPQSSAVNTTTTPKPQPPPVNTATTSKPQPNQLRQAVEVLEKSPDRIQFQGLGSIQHKEKNEAQVHLHFLHTPSSQELIMKLTLERGEHWRVVRWENLAEVVEQMKNLEAEVSS